jgi:SPP1 gp7 family putative phage head morphogenesis protein
LTAKGFSSREAVRTAETDEGVVQALDTLWVDTEEQATSYLNTLARTNLFEAMNEARYAEFTDPALDNFVVAFRYSAILDERTTEICQSLDDSVYNADNPVWDEYRPPNHFNSVPSSTLVTTLRGELPIREVIAGDMVLTHRGRYRPVYAVMRKRGDTDTLLAIKTDTGGVLRATGEHPVLTTRGWKRSDELQVGDVLFERAQQEAGVNDMLVPDPKHFPSLFDQPLIPYEVVSGALGSMMRLPVQFQKDAMGGECEVCDVSADDELEFVTDFTAAEQGDQLGFRPRGFGSHGPSLSRDDVVLVGVPRVSAFHAEGGIGAGLSEAPMVPAGSLGNHFGQPSRDAHLFSLGAHGDTVTLAPARQHGFADSQVALDGAQGRTVLPVTDTDQPFDGALITQVHGDGPRWIGATIVSIDATPCNESLWNIAVLDDESYVADKFIVHNCRSVLIPVTQVDVQDGEWDGQESDPPTVQPQEGFK